MNRDSQSAGEGARSRIPHGPGQYGSRNYCIKVPKTISKSGEIYVNGDGVAVNPNGDLIVTGGHRGHFDATPECPVIVLAMAKGAWIAFYIASCLDGSALAVQHWEGEVAR